MKYYVAREPDESLYLFLFMPVRQQYRDFFSDKGRIIYSWRAVNDDCKLLIDPELFPEVTWDSSPKEVELDITKVHYEPKES